MEGRPSGSVTGQNMLTCTYKGCWNAVQSLVYLSKLPPNSNTISHVQVRKNVFIAFRYEQQAWARSSCCFSCHVFSTGICQFICVLFGKRCTCSWWLCWAPLHTALSTSTGLCFGCSRQTRPEPGARSAPPLVPSPYAGDRYEGPPSRAWRRHVWWAEKKGEHWLKSKSNLERASPKQVMSLRK